MNGREGRGLWRMKAPCQFGKPPGNLGISSTAEKSMYSRPNWLSAPLPTGHSKCANTGNSGRCTARSADVGLIMHRPSVSVHCSRSSSGQLAPKTVARPEIRATLCTPIDIPLEHVTEEWGEGVVVVDKESTSELDRVFFNYKFTFKPISLSR